MQTGLTRDHAPLAVRLGGLARTYSLAIEAGAVAFAVLIFLISVLPNLANYPVPTDDEVWVMSAAYRLVEDGIFGSAMFEGFFNADQRYYFNMPLHHFAIAASFKLFGAGILQARLVGVLYGVATLLLTYLLARRVAGVPAAVLSLVLLLFLRFGMGFDTGLPLQELAANMRYDLAPVLFMLGGALVLLGATSMTRAAIAGVLFGLAVLMQFYGAFMLPIAIAFLWLEALPRPQRLKLIGALLGAALLVGLPYGAYILNGYDDFKGQAGTIDRRADFARPSFYYYNVIGELNRFEHPLAIPYLFHEVQGEGDIFTTDPKTIGLEALARRPSAKLGVLAGLPLALAFFGWRAFKQGGRDGRLLLLCLGGLVLEYTLLEWTKFYIYWIAVVPFLCIGIAGAVVWLLQPPRHDLRRLAMAAVTAVALLLVLAEGSVARLGGLRNAQAATEYSALATAVHEHVPPGSRVIGATALWWGLRDTDYRSYFQFFYLTRPDALEYRTTIPQFVTSFDADYIVLTRKAFGELQDKLSNRDRDHLNAVLANATQVTKLEDGPAHPYGYVLIWKLP